MTTARQHQANLDSTPYYHCVSRCVRRAFLYGEDTLTGRNFDHRKQWLVDRLQYLSDLFAIDICAYAVMSNHYHVVLHVDSDRARRWNDVDIIRRWSALFSDSLAAKIARSDVLVEDEDLALSKSFRQWRQRLTDISWFMRCLNEPLARQVNGEDDAKPCLSITFESYLELVDWTGRVLRHDNKGAIPAHITPILQQLGLHEKKWLPTVSGFQKHFYRVAGSADAMRAWCKRIGQCWLKGIPAARLIYRHESLHC